MIIQGVSKFALMAGLAMGLAACGSGNNESSESAGDEQAGAEVEMSQAEKLRAFFRDAMMERLEREPLQAERLGFSDNNDKWPDLSQEAQDEMRTLYEEQLAELRQFDLAGIGEQLSLSARLFELTAERYVRNDKWRLYSYPINQMYGWHTYVPTHLMTVHKVADKADAEAYIARLAGVRDLFAQVVDGLRLREEKGILPPKFVFPKVIKAARNVVSGAPFDEGEDSILMADFRTKVGALDLPEAEAEALLERARTALREGVKPGYEALIAALEDQATRATSKHGVWKFPEGDAFYDQALANHTTTDLTAEEVHQIGLDNVARIHEAMRAIVDEVDFDGDLQEFFEFTRTDERFYLPNTDEGREEYLQQARDYIEDMRVAVPDYFSLTPKASMEVRAVEKFREESAGKAFYQRSAPDGSRPGIYYVNLHDMKNMPTYQLEALSYHEGIPGHHFQIAIAQELEGLPLFQRTARFTAFTEGWGLYTEELGKDMGFYEDPYSDFGRLAMELWRACRLVVDTGIHHKQWTREDAIDYLVENTPNPRGDAVAAIERYIVMPGQATAYMVGKLKIMELREKARETLGSAFSWRDFHRVVLENGMVPLSVLEDKVNAWIEAEKQAAQQETPAA